MQIIREEYFVDELKNQIEILKQAQLEATSPKIKSKIAEQILRAMEDFKKFEVVIYEPFDGMLEYDSDCYNLLKKIHNKIEKLLFKKYK